MEHELKTSISAYSFENQLKAESRLEVALREVRAELRAFTRTEMDNYFARDYMKLADVDRDFTRKHDVERVFMRKEDAFRMFITSYHVELDFLTKDDVYYDLVQHVFRWTEVVKRKVKPLADGEGNRMKEADAENDVIKTDDLD